MRRYRVPAWRAAAVVSFLTLSQATGAQGQTLTLGDAVAAALSTHPDVAAADARVAAAGDAGDAARAALLPGAALSGTLTRFEEPMLVAPIHSLDFANLPSFDRTLVQSQLAAQYTLFDGGARSARIRGADATHEATQLARSDALMQVIEETVAAYVGVLAARAVFEASVTQVRALEEERGRAGRELSAGTAAELEVLRAAATLQQARADEASSLARVGLSERALARLIGATPGEVVDRPLADLGVRATVARGDAARDPQTSPQVMKAVRAVDAAEARLAEERGGRFPAVQAGAGLLDFGTISGGHLVEWQAGLQVSWPLFTGGARSAAVRRARADLTASESDLRAVRLRVSQAMDAAETSVLEADARAEALEVAVSQWEEVARIEALALEAGSGVQGDLLRAQAGLFQARAGHARARYDAVVARARLARVEGTLDRAWINASLEAR